MRRGRRRREEEERKIEMISMDMILSYWLFVWWIMYELGIVRENPKLMLIIGLIVNVIMLLIKIVKGSRTLIPFVIINTLIKVLPLLMLMRTRISEEDVEGSLIVVLIYVLWVILNVNKVKRYMNKRVMAPFEYWWTKNIKMKK
jgi:hypothetical protein